MRSLESLKREAKQAKKDMNEQGISCTHMQALEAVAKNHGYRSYGAAKVALEKGIKS